MTKVGTIITLIHLSTKVVVQETKINHIIFYLKFGYALIYDHHIIPLCQKIIHIEKN